MHDNMKSRTQIKNNIKMYEGFNVVWPIMSKSTDER